MARTKGSKNLTSTQNQYVGTNVTATELRQAFWQTFQDLKSGALDPAAGNAMTAAGRGVLSTVKLEIQVAELTKSAPSKNLVGFTQN